jgi:hypothetical protein
MCGVSVRACTIKYGVFRDIVHIQPAKSFTFETFAAAPQLHFIAERLGGVALRHAHADTG